MGRCGADFDVYGFTAIFTFRLCVVGGGGNCFSFGAYYNDPAVTTFDLAPVFESTE